MGNKKRIGNLDVHSPVPYSPTLLSSSKDNPNTPSSKKYTSRTNAGQVLIRFGNGGNPLPASTWISPEATFCPEVKVHSPVINRKDYRYMFERLREKAGYLDEIICKTGDFLIEENNLSETQSICQVAPEPFHAVGRVCCDSDGRLNSKSIVLQGSQDICLGRSVPLDATKVTEYSLFPGQIVAAEVTNPNGNKLIATKFYSNATTPKPANKIRLKDGDTMQVVVACGPYTTADNLSYEPLNDLLTYILKHRPHLVILCGPFVDAKHNAIDGCSCEEAFEVVFVRVMKRVVDTLEQLPSTQVLVVPSGSRDVHHTFIYPTPPFEDAQSCNRIHMMTDPCIVNVEGVLFGVTSTDVLFHLGKEEISIPRSGDRLRRLSTHLINQRSFYPLYPPSEEMNIDHEQLELVACLDIQPHILILPSDFLHFFKEINGCVVMNPQRLAKGDGGGVFARLIIRGTSSQDVSNSQDFAKHVSAEVVRI